MNKKDECRIVEDLLYSYSESILNETSNKFVKIHLKDCENCKNKLEIIKCNILDEKSKEKQEDEIELSHLLKVNKVIRILKTSLIILIALILLVLGYIVFRSNQTDYVVKKAYNTLETLQQSDNYKISKREIYISHEDANTNDITNEIYYKNGKYKEILPGSIFFYKDDDNKITYIFEELKSIEKNLKPVIHKGDILKEDSGIRSIYNNDKTIFQKSAYEIVNDTFNGIDCYVVRIELNNKEYRELWINKENFITTRIIENFSAYYREYIYDITLNKTLDSDVTLNINEYNGYTVKDFT